MFERTKTIIKENWKFTVLIVAIFLLFKIELPYKIYAPGGMVNLTDRVSVQDGYTHDGELGMAYVSMVRGSLPFLAASYFIPDWDIVAKSEITYDNESFEETFKADQISTQQSIDSAIIAAYRLAGKEVTVEQEVVHVTHIDDQAQTGLKLFDVILSVEGESISSMDDLRNIIAKHQEGDTISMTVLRDDEEITVDSTIYLLDGAPKVGISITITYEYDESPEAVIETKASESGPSGGLMMSLAIYNALMEEDITGGKRIIGTGTIDIEGNVGEIGGVRYKLIGAVHEDADAFLVPVGNYDEAVEVAEEKGYDIPIISVSSLSEAIEALKNL